MCLKIDFNANNLSRQAYRLRKNFNLKLFRTTDLFLSWQEYAKFQFVEIFKVLGYHPVILKSAASKKHKNFQERDGA